MITSTFFYNQSARYFNVYFIGTDNQTGGLNFESYDRLFCAGDKIEKNEMGRACGTYGEREKCAQGFGGEA